MKEEMNIEVEETQAQKPRGGRVLRVLFGLAFAILLGVILGAGAYFGLPFLYQELVAPIQANIEGIAELERRVTSVEEVQEAASLAYESQISAQGETQADLVTQIDSLEGSVSDLELRFELQADQLETLRTLQRELRVVQGELEDLSSEVDEFRSGAAGEALVEKSLQQETKLLEAMVFLLRARLWLIEDNLGFAVTETQSARAVLQQIPFEEGGPDLSPVIDRLDLALEDMQTSPLVAADDLEIAWKLLQQLMLSTTSPE